MSSACAPAQAVHPAPECCDPRWPGWREKWTPRVLWFLFVYFGLCLIALDHLPNTLWDPRLRQVTIVIGALGIWRYSWWLTHAVRAFIYGRFVYPRMRRQAETVWQSGWRPRHLHFLVTTFREHRETTEKVMLGICREVRACGVPATLWLGSSEPRDEGIVADFLDRCASDLDLTLRIVRQNRPGKRMALGLALRAMSRSVLHRDDVVVFMDGDFIAAPGALARCLPLFRLYPDLHALTTDEEVACEAPQWARIWLSLRFAQRRITMQSHALSGRVLTLTGRMSVFRAEHVTKLAFIRMLEADYLDHWLWGRFRFLSGDDKSTWFYLLQQGARMLYVPDAFGYTVEVFEGKGYRRMALNFLRWSGNMLRNGARAIALGPRRMPFFIWWCLVDQRIAMWTMLVAPMLAVSSAILHGAEYLIAYIILTAVSRMLLSLFLFMHARKIYVSWPFFLYLNQMVNAAVKVHAVSRLAHQRWANRGEQRLDFDAPGLATTSRNLMASYVTAVYVACLLIGVIHSAALIELPSATILGSFWFELAQLLPGRIS